MELWLGTPEVPIPCVDVRSVAEAHRAAAFLPHAMGRYIVSASHQETSLSLARILAQRQYSKTVEYPIELGLEYLPIAPDVQDMFQQIVDAGVVGPKRWYFRLVHG
jgi:hypothetical protein